MNERTTVMIRTAGGQWRTPSVNAYGNERALQHILADTPELIPGVGAAVCADELPIPGSGSLDLVAVEPDGSITLVECKLAANAEVRRSVVGQIASYAAGLWNMTFEAFDDAFRTRTDARLIDRVAAITNDDSWDAEEFRRAVIDNLSHGRFRMVIAVDSITEELKRIVEYLNAHTTSDIELLALEIGYVAEGNIEILLPVTHGAESVRLKTTGRSTRSKWTVDEVFAALETLCEPDSVNEIRRLGDELSKYGGYWQPGASSYPTMSAYVPVGPEARTRSLVAIYADPSGPTAPRLTINLGSLAKDLTEEELRQIVSILETSPQLASHLQRVHRDGYTTYPPIPLADFAKGYGAATLLQAVASHLGGDGSDRTAGDSKA